MVSYASRIHHGANLPRHPWGTCSLSHHRRVDRERRGVRRLPAIHESQNYASHAFAHSFSSDFGQPSDGSHRALCLATRWATSAILSLGGTRRC